METISYSELTGWREESRRFGELLEFPVIASQYGAIRDGYHGGLVLDVGAGIHHQLKKVLGLDAAAYRSLDSDPRGRFDYGAFSDIPPDLQFGLITMLQVLEHLTIDEAHGLLRQARRVLAPGGTLFISVPNAVHPIRYHVDVTHVTNWNTRDLYGLLRHVGFDVQRILRSNKQPLTRHPLKRWLVKTICSQFRVDWCDTIVLVAGQPSA
jgi:SAM-dependent methyltransferase